MKGTAYIINFRNLYVKLFNNLAINKPLFKHLGDGKISECFKIFCYPYVENESEKYLKKKKKLGKSSYMHNNNNLSFS